MVGACVLGLYATLIAHKLDALMMTMSENRETLMTRVSIIAGA
jgi:hypothetical protein